MSFPPLVLKHVPFVLLAVLNTIAIAQESTIVDPGEKNGLHAILVIFQDPTLTSNWTGEPCDNNDQARWIGIQCTNGHISGIVLESRGLMGELIFGQLGFLNLPHLTILSFKNNSLRGNMMELTNNPQIKYIDLSGNQLDGSISSSFFTLNLLDALLLQDNRLTGNIPEFRQPSLKIFNVSNNDLEASIPETPTLQSFPSDSYSGNPRLCGPPSLNSCSAINDFQQNSSNKNNSHNFPLILNIFLLLAVALLLMVYCNTARKLNKLTKEKIATVRDEENVGGTVQTEAARATGIEEQKELIFFKERPKFQMGELLRASAKGLGRGILGNSYKALLHGGPTIVVKRPRDLKPLTKEEFAKLLHPIADMEHPNLLPLLDYYYSQDEKLLLYEYAQNGNLFLRLQGGRDRNRVPFRWRSRLSVARGVARALDYLHQNANWHPNIVPHGHLKSSNVLLDKDDKPLVSDFGLASLITPPIATQRMVVFKSPEYEKARKVTKQSDVWSYGLLLIELLASRISACSAPPGIQGLDLVNWVHRAVREERFLGC